MNQHHTEILDLIVKHSGTPTKHTYLDDYLGNDHPRYPINIPTLRKLASAWMKDNLDLSAKEFASLISSLMEGKSSTEKTTGGILLDYATKEQRSFSPKLFNSWLNHIKGWAEIDSLCTSKYTATEVLNQWDIWEPQLISFSKSKDITKRRASIVVLCVPLRKTNDKRLAELALVNIDRLKHEDDVLITKAISWVLRTMIKHHKKVVADYLKVNQDTLPKIAVRETMTKLKTGTKTKRKTS
ncbi:MAG TPA: DNA alkylation repair protein [Cyclobacteriaceae bacterium]|jgi:3-methyladenine DNA glycosylase AlkD|nr:DNA alkylation repair protein [Cyclobacteriaceae bacterium]